MKLLESKLFIRTCLLPPPQLRIWAGLGWAFEQLSLQIRHGTPYWAVRNVILNKIFAITDVSDRRPIGDQHVWSETDMPNRTRMGHTWSSISVSNGSPMRHVCHQWGISVSDEAIWSSIRHIGIRWVSAQTCRSPIVYDRSPIIIIFSWVNSLFIKLFRFKILRSWHYSLRNPIEFQSGNVLGLSFYPLEYYNNLYFSVLLGDLWVQIFTKHIIFLYFNFAVFAQYKTVL